MGLCKCPKRKVTNQFCYEHRVNVCQYCMVTCHPKCVVQSYIHWLQDSDYDPTCPLCRGDLNIRETVRLVCFHVFHWDCLDCYVKLLPETIAPAGLCCPKCGGSIIPKGNLVSPVADVLRVKLSNSKWARMGLGLPPMEDELNNVHNGDELMPDQSLRWSSHYNLVNQEFQEVDLPSTCHRQIDIMPRSFEDSSSRSKDSSPSQPRRPLPSAIYRHSEEEDKYTRRSQKLRRFFSLRKCCRFLIFTLILTAFVVAMFMITQPKKAITQPERKRFKPTFRSYHLEDVYF